MIKKFKAWVLLSLVTTALAGLAYTLGQQVLRQSANDPQIQMSEDLAAALASGKLPKDIISKDKVDMAQSLAPYVVVFDEKGQPLASTAILDGQTPTLPDGVLAYTKLHGQDIVTWQPRAGVRSAAVITHYNGGYVLAGRSLREVEKREDRVLKLTVLAWLATMAGILVTVVILV